MNFIFGVFLGLIANNWMAVLFVPFTWGISVCLFISIIRPDRMLLFLDKQKERGTIKFRSAKNDFYFVEYTTATLTSLVFAIITYSIKLLF